MNETPEVKRKWYQFSKSSDLNSTWSLQIESKESAYKLLIEISWVLIIYGLVHIALTFLLPSAWIDGLLYIFTGSLLGHKKSIWAAWVAIGIISLECLGVFYTHFIASEGGNVWLVAIILFFTIKTLYAIRFLNGETIPPSTRWQKVGEKIFPTLFWISSVAMGGLIIITIIGSIALMSGAAS